MASGVGRGGWGCGGGGAARTGILVDNGKHHKNTDQGTNKLAESSE